MWDTDAHVTDSRYPLSIDTLYGFPMGLYMASSMENSRISNCSTITVFYRTLSGAHTTKTVSLPAQTEVAPGALFVELVYYASGECCM